MNLPGLFHKQTVQGGFWTAEKWKMFTCFTSTSHEWPRLVPQANNARGILNSRKVKDLYVVRKQKENSLFLLQIVPGVWFDKMGMLLVNKKRWIKKPVQHRNVSCISRRNDTMFIWDNILHQFLEILFLCQGVGQQPRGGGGSDRQATKPSQDSQQSTSPSKERGRTSHDTSSRAKQGLCIWMLSLMGGKKLQVKIWTMHGFVIVVIASTTVAETGRWSFCWIRYVGVAPCE